MHILLRIVKIKTLHQYCKIARYKSAKQSILSWLKEMKQAQWKNVNELKFQYRNASIIGDKRIIFNIKGNAYRLIVDIEYQYKIIFIVWFGTHAEYDKINAKTIKYEA
jgi:mRNA interferase HigB